MTGVREYIIPLILGGLFAFALISAGIAIAESNHANQSIGDEPILAGYKTSLETTLEEAHDSANASQTALSSSPLTLTSGTGIIFDAIGGIWKTLFVIPITLYNLTFNVVFTQILGSDQYALVFSVISAIILIGIIFAVWKWVSTGADE